MRFSFLSRHFITGYKEALSLSDVLTACFPRRGRAGTSRPSSWAVWQHHLQESPASWLHPVHLLRREPGPSEIEAASALFRPRVTSPLRAQFNDHPYLVCCVLACKIKSAESWGLAREMVSLFHLPGEWWISDTAADLVFSKYLETSVCKEFFFKAMAHWRQP